MTGVGGQLGHDVMNELAKRGYEGIGSDIAPLYSGIEDGTAVTSMPYVQMDITDQDSVKKVIRQAAPDAVIHCAAWTAVDSAEDEENREKVRLVNVVGTQNIADICKELDIKMLYLSTDYVFDGQGETPGSLTARIISRSMFMERPSLPENLLFPKPWTNSLLSALHGYLEKTEKTL